MQSNTIIRFITQKSIEIPTLRLIFCLILSVGSVLSTHAQQPAPAAQPAGAPSSPAPATPQNQPKENTPKNANAKSDNPRTQNSGKAAQLSSKNLPSGKTDSTNNAQVVQDGVSPEILARRKKIFGYDIFNNKNVSFQPSQFLATARDYTVGPGDELLIYIYGYSQNQLKATVNNDGFIFLERAGAVFVSGNTIDEIKKILINRLSKFYLGMMGQNGERPATTMEVTIGKLRTIKVTVTGEAITPGSYSLSSLSSALNALYQSGGPTENGSFREIKVIRKNKVIETIDLYEYLLRGTLVADIRLQDNDNIFVPVYSKQVEIIGNVKRPGIYELTAKESLERAFYYAGNFSQNAYTSRVKVRGLSDRERTINEVEKKDFATYTPSNGDEIEVGLLLDRFANLVLLNGAVYREGEYSLSQNPTLLTLIKNAEGLKGDAFTGRINVIRTREDLSVESISLDLAAIINGTQPDFELKREDVVTITSKFDLAERGYVRISGEVNNPDFFETPYYYGISLADVIVKAGGMKESAQSAQVEVVRRKKDVNLMSATAQVSEVFRFNVNRNLSLDVDDNKFMLQPYDEIIIRKAPNYQPQTFVSIEGEVLSPGEYGIINKDEKISDLLIRAGGLTPQAYTAGATLVRTVKLSAAEIERREKSINLLSNDASKGAFQAEQISENSEESVGINLGEILKKPNGSEDLILQDGDLLRIPKRLETVRVQGEVLYPTTIKFRGGTFMDYVSQAGGFTSRSLKRKCYVVYPNGSIDRTRKFLFVNIYPRIEPGTDVIVPVRTAADLDVNQSLNRIIGISTSLMTLITSVLLFRTIR